MLERILFVVVGGMWLSMGSMACSESREPGGPDAGWRDAAPDAVVDAGDGGVGDDGGPEGDAGPMCDGPVIGACADDELSCECCPAGGPAQSCLCTTPCVSDDDCDDPARPVCNQPADGVEGMCTPDDFVCCWFCL